MRVLILVLVAACGCQGSFNEIKDQGSATTIVWEGVYGRAGYGTPRIEWIYGKDLDCADGKGFSHGLYWGAIERNTCVLGVSWPDLNIVQIAHPNGWKFSDNVFAHELWHVSLNIDGIYDQDHKDPGFGIRFGYPYGIVDEADRELAEVGL